MNSTERLLELVELSEHVKNLANELNLEFIGLMADMVLAESTRTLYEACDEADQPADAEDAGETSGCVLSHEAPPPSSNVMQLTFYRDRKRAG
jgi:hypothetical protein